MIEGYVCKTDFDYHLGIDSLGTTIYPSVRALRRHKKMC